MEKVKHPNIVSVWNKKPSFLNLADNLLLGLSARSREIIRKRFGLSGEYGETLEKIGRDYGITRERVRQIISEALNNISAKSGQENFLEAEGRIIFTIERNDGIIKASDIVEKFNSSRPKEANAIRFFAVCSKKIFEIGEKGFFEKAWVISKDIAQNVKEVITRAEKIIQEEKKLSTDQEIFDKLSFLKVRVSKSEALNFLRTSSRVKKNKFEKWGLIGWMEVNPKGTREKVHLILKEKKTPLHFTEIAALIDKFQLGKRKAHPQTVHNELIKDERFVLIGRGIYALKEWGYFAGTIKDVIKNILDKKDHGLTKEEIIKKVLKVRRVKKTTIMINLNNRKFFEKKRELYTVKR